MIERIYILESVDPVIFYGVNNVNMQLIKTLFPKLRIVARGNVMKVIGDEDESELFLKKIREVEKYCEEFNSLSEDVILDIIKGKAPVITKQENLIIHGMNGKPIVARTENQQRLVKAFEENDLVFATGPAGTGKTFIAIALAVKALKNKEIRKIILSRPAVEAGEKLGFLPGEMKDKLDPYLQPLYDALQDMVPGAKLKEYMENNVIQIAPLAFMRGRTLNDAVIILDEAQNTKGMTKALTKTDFNFPGQKSVYHGKVRDVYNINDDVLVMVATDRISAFDVVLPEGIPYKGQMLNQIAAKFLDATTDICPNWKLATPDPMVTVGVMCQGFPVEMIVRGYLCGSAWRAYKSGVREICGIKLPEGMRENERFPEPIVTPTTKAEIGEHDADISKEEILAQGLATPEEYELLEKYTLALFKRGTEIAAERGLILVDTKYEFGKHGGKIYLMDEIHTPDSSRYFYSEGYEERFAKGEPQKQLSKEFVREWLMENGFQGKAGQKVPEMTPAIVDGISERYIELYEHITGEKFEKGDTDNLLSRIEKNVTEYLNK